MKKKITVLALCCTLYGSLTNAEDLLTIYQQALEADPKLQSSQAQMQVGVAQTGQALGDMLPQASGMANWSTNDQRRAIAASFNRGASHENSSYHGTRYTVSLNQTLIDLGKFWNWRRAQKVEDQLTAENNDVLNKLMFSVVEGYFSVLEAADQLYFIQTEKEATQKKQEQIKQQYAKQLVKITDLYEIEALQDKIAADEIEAEKILAVAKEGLMELTNRQPNNLRKLLPKVNYQPLEGKIEDWLEIAKNQNPALVSELNAIEAAKDNVSAQLARNFPVVDLQLNYYMTNTGYQSSFIGNTEVQTAAINVTVPLFSGGSTLEKMNEAKSRLLMARAENEGKVRAIIKETRDAFLTTNANYKRIQASEKAVLSSTKSRESMEQGFAFGVQTLSDVLTTQQNEFKMKRELSQAKYSYIKNKMRFMYATGMINEQHLQEINQWLEK